MRHGCISLGSKLRIWRAEKACNEWHDKMPPWREHMESNGKTGTFLPVLPGSDPTPMLTSVDMACPHTKPLSTHGKLVTPLPGGLWTLSDPSVTICSGDSTFHRLVPEALAFPWEASLVSCLLQSLGSFFSETPFGGSSGTAPSSLSSCIVPYGDTWSRCFASASSRVSLAAAHTSLHNSHLDSYADEGSSQVD